MRASANASLSGRRPPLRASARRPCASLVRGRVRCEPARELKRHDHEDGVDQSALGLHIDVKNADGTTTPWMIEGATPNTLLRRGFTRDAVKTGTEITIVGYRAKNGANRANGRDLILPDGSRLVHGVVRHGRARRGRAAEPEEQE